MPPFQKLHLLRKSRGFMPHLTSRRICAALCKPMLPTTMMSERTSLDKDAPTFCPVQRASFISSRSALGGFQYHYVWV